MASIHHARKECSLSQLGQLFSLTFVSMFFIVSHAVASLQSCCSLIASLSRVRTGCRSLISPPSGASVTQASLPHAWLLLCSFDKSRPRKHDIIFVFTCSSQMFYVDDAKKKYVTLTLTPCAAAQLKMFYVFFTLRFET